MSDAPAVRIRIETDEPYLAGHFPGDPVVPGAVILELVIEALSRRAGARPKVRRIDAVKFLRPLRPGDELDIELDSLDEITVRFACRSAGGLIATGTIQAGASMPQP